mmetsp:Transcript_39930/g.60364  ORF Transcript_39930/g.60364 Transcript_39930/m.60364 type:complete len:634 (+) Transcript_39930:422-2323(+)
MSSDGDKPDTASDELVSQFLAFTGSSDPSTATNYLEMSGNNLDTAVGLYFEHQQAGGGSNSSSRGSSSRAANADSVDPFASISSGAGGDVSSSMMSEDGVRAPDQSRRMRLLDFNDHGTSSSGAASAMAAMNHPAALLASGLLSGGIDPDVGSMMSAFSSRPLSSSTNDVGIDLTGSGGPGVFDARAAVNAAADAQRGQSSNDVGGDEGENDESAAAAASARPASRAATLSDMFAPPINLMHRGGGFQGARNVARDSRRWLIVNLQSDSEFACHALNRDVWRDDLVEGLVKEGFIFWQSTDTVGDGQTYMQRYNVNAFPHVGIIDPRTARLMWRKEGWTQANPLTATQFAEIAADFCSRHSFDKPPVAPRQAETNGTNAAATPAKRSVHELSEQQQLQAAIAASMNDANDDDDEYDMDDDDDIVIDSDDDDEVIIDDDDEVVCVGSGTNETMAPVTETEKEEEKKPRTLEEEIVTMDIGDEPAAGKDIARVQIRMPDGKRLVRKFRRDDTVKVIYAFVAVSRSLLIYFSSRMYICWSSQPFVLNDIVLLRLVPQKIREWSNYFFVAKSLRMLLILTSLPSKSFLSTQQSSEEAKNGKSFILKAGFPPRDLSPEIENTIQNCGLAGESITARWS